MKNVIKLWKEILIVLLLIVCFVSTRSCSDKKDTINLLTNANDSAYNVATYYKTKNGELVGQVKTHNITIKTLKNNIEVLGLNEKKLTNHIGRLSNLVAYWEGKANVTNTVEIHSVDTIIKHQGENIEGKSFNWSNKYLTLHQIYNPLSEVMTTTYDYKVDFSITAYRDNKAKKLFKPKTWFKKPVILTDIYFSDPDMKVNEFKGIVVDDPKKKFYQTTGFKLSLGFIAGFYMGVKILK